MLGWLMWGLSAPALLTVATLAFINHCVPAGPLPQHGEPWYILIAADPFLLLPNYDRRRRHCVAATAPGCAFAAGSASFECSNVICDCSSGCPAAYLKTFQNVHGTVTIDCDTTGQACTIVVSGVQGRVPCTCCTAALGVNGVNCCWTAALGDSGVKGSKGGQSANVAFLTSLTPAWLTRLQPCMLAACVSHSFRHSFWNLCRCLLKPI